MESLSAQPTTLFADSAVALPIAKKASMFSLLIATKIKRCPMTGKKT